jgi:hypothetical protein
MEKEGKKEEKQTGKGIRGERGGKEEEIWEAYSCITVIKTIVNKCHGLNGWISQKFMC